MTDMPTNTYTADRVLASGRIAFVVNGKAELMTCSWLVQVPNGHPEPDSPADCYDTVECGAPVYAINRDLDAGYRCSNGHEHLTYGSPAQQAAESVEAFIEQQAQTNPALAARLDDPYFTEEEINAMFAPHAPGNEPVAHRYQVLVYHGDNGTWTKAPGQGDPMLLADAQAFIAAQFVRGEYKLRAIHNADVNLWECPCLECTHLEYESMDRDISLGEFRRQEWPEVYGTVTV